MNKLDIIENGMIFAYKGKCYMKLGNSAVPVKINMKDIISTKDFEDEEIVNIFKSKCKYKKIMGGMKYE